MRGAFRIEIDVCRLLSSVLYPYLYLKVFILEPLFEFSYLCEANRIQQKIHSALTNDK